MTDPRLVLPPVVLASVEILSFEPCAGCGKPRIADTERPA